MYCYTGIYCTYCTHSSSIPLAISLSLLWTIELILYLFVTLYKPMYFIVSWHALHTLHSPFHFFCNRFLKTAQVIRFSFCVTEVFTIVTHVTDTMNTPSQSNFNDHNLQIFQSYLQNLSKLTFPLEYFRNSSNTNILSKKVHIYETSIDQRWLPRTYPVSNSCQIFAKRMTSQNSVKY